MKNLLRWVIAISLVLPVLLLSPLLGLSDVVYAATTANVTVTATPEFISITDNVTTYDFGTVAASSTTNTTTTYVGITNASTVQTDQTIGVATVTWAGGVTWAHAEDAVPGTDLAGLKAERGGVWGAAEVIVKNGSPNFIYENCGATTSYDYGLSLIAPTGFTDGVQKSIVVVVTAAAG